MQRGADLTIKKKNKTQFSCNISLERYYLSTKKSTYTLELDSKLSQMKIEREKVSPSVLQPPSLQGCSAGSPRSSQQTLCSSRSGLRTAARSVAACLLSEGAVMVLLTPSLLRSKALLGTEQNQERAAAN